MRETSGKVEKVSRFQHDINSKLTQLILAKVSWVRTTNINVPQYGCTTVDQEIFAAHNFHVLNFSAFNFRHLACKYSAK